MLFISRNWAVVCHSVDSDDTPRARELIGLSDYKHYKHLHQMRCGCMWTLRVDCSLRPAVKVWRILVFGACCCPCCGAGENETACHVEATIYDDRMATLSDRVQVIAMLIAAQRTLPLANAYCCYSMGCGPCTNPPCCSV